MRRATLLVVVIVAVIVLGTGIAMALDGGTSGELNYRYTSLNQSQGAYNTVRVACPANRHVTGGGATTVAEGAQWLVSSSPFDSSADADPVPDDGWRVTVYNGGSA